MLVQVRKHMHNMLASAAKAPRAKEQDLWKEWHEYGWVVRRGTQVAVHILDAGHGAAQPAGPPTTEAGSRNGKKSQGIENSQFEGAANDA